MVQWLMPAAGGAQLRQLELLLLPLQDGCGNHLSILYYDHFLHFK